MEINYTIAGADGQTYGPVSLQELQTWIRDGRVNAQSNILRSDINAWHPASQYQELSFAGGAGTPPPLPQAGAKTSTYTAGQFPDLEKRIKSGAGWFYWIAGLSIINAITIFTGETWGFFLSLGSVQFASALAGAIGLVLSLLICGAFIVFGIFANKRHSWAFITGMVFYALDSLIFLFLQEWGSLAFHIFALLCIFAGLKANMNLKKQTGL